MGSRLKLAIMEKTSLQKILISCKVIAGFLSFLHFSLIVAAFASFEEKTKYPSEQVLIIGITLIFWTSQFWCSIAMIIAACGILTTLLSVASWGYLFGFLFYLSLFLTEVIDEFRFRTVFTFAFVAVLHLYGFVVGRVSVTEIRNQKDQQKKTSIDEII